MIRSPDTNEIGVSGHDGGEWPVAEDDRFDMPECICAQSFRPNVGQFILGRDGPQLHHTLGTAFLQMANPNRDVLLFFCELRRVAHGNRRPIVN